MKIGRARGSDFGELSPDCNPAKGFLDLMKTETLDLCIQAGTLGKQFTASQSPPPANIFQLRGHLLPQHQRDAGTHITAKNFVNAECPCRHNK